MNDLVIALWIICNHLFKTRLRTKPNTYKGWDSTLSSGMRCLYAHPLTRRTDIIAIIVSGSCNLGGLYFLCVFALDTVPFLSNSYFFLFFYFFIFRERGREGGREGNISVGVASHTCPPGDLAHTQPRHVPWLGIELATVWFAGWRSGHWATPARAE